VITGIARIDELWWSAISTGAMVSTIVRAIMFSSAAGVRAQN
jgi:hypothetical protein